MATPHSRHFRHRLYARVRHGRKLAAWLAAEATAIASSASGQTVAPEATDNTKARLLVTFGGQPAAGNTLTVGNTTYTFVSALTEAKAAGTLTNDGTNVANGATVTIDGVVYTFKTALTEAKAAGTLTNDGTNVSNTETVTIDGKVYTFQDTLTEVDGHVKIGLSNTASMTNLFHAINASGGTAGVDYATATTAHPAVVATNPSGTTVVVTAKAVGVAGNARATTEASAHLSFGAVTLAGGVDSVANEVAGNVSNTASMTALFEAINAGANGGVDYSSATLAHPTVLATNPTGTTVVVTAQVAGTAGNARATTETSAHLSFGAVTLAGGVDSVANEVLISDTAAHTRDALVAAITAGAGSGTTYSRATVAHPAVTAAASAGNALLTMRTACDTAPGYRVAVSKVGTNLSLPAWPRLDGPAWTATGHAFHDGEGPMLLTTSTTLPAGALTGQVFVHVLDANTVALASSLGAMRRGDFMQTTDAGTGTHTLTRDVTAAGIFGALRKNDPRTVAAATDVDALA